MNNQNHIAPEYKKRLLRLKNSFPTAYNFLVYPEQNKTSIWLSTSVNAHLYFKDYYLAYIKIKDNELIIRAKFNNLIVGHTTDKSHLLFSGTFQNLITSFDGIKNGWAKIESDKVIIKKGAPEIIFKTLLSVIENLK